MTLRLLSPLSNPLTSSSLCEMNLMEDSKLLPQKSFDQTKKRNDLLTDFGKAVLDDRYLMEGEDYQECFQRVAKAYSDDEQHAKRLYDYISRLWFMPSTPILSNAGTGRGLPISCYLNEATDSLEGITSLWTENIWLASSGGGIGSYWGNLRSIGEKIARNGETCGIMPFIKVMDSLTLAISQGSLRRGSAAVYLPIDHPEIEEFLEMRRPTGGDPNRKALYLNHGVTVSDKFMEAVESDSEWALCSPKDRSFIRMVSARALWIKMLTMRIETGEPYIIFIDHVNKAIPEQHKQLGLYVKTSNLCSEIVLPTGIDHLGQDRTAICCLSSVNLEYYCEWENHPCFIEDCMRFLDNVLTDYIERAPDSMARAKYAASRERSVGLGVMGFHSFLQKNQIPIESALSKSWNVRIFKTIHELALLASKKLSNERGACPDALECGINERFSNKMAIAPTASISIICGGTSPGIDPYYTNVYLHKTKSGSVLVKNKNLELLLEKKGLDTAEIWGEILQNEGSVQNLQCLNANEKKTFKTAFELDQRFLVELAADRTPYICQSQSLNLFLTSNVHKKDLHQIHMSAWKKGIKSLYYLRSQSLQRAEKDYKNSAIIDECLACQ